MGLNYKGLTFDGVNSLDYGIYITGEGVYNAPTRDVEMITIAGRNGEYALDKGRFNNISITYKAGTFGQDQTDFAEKISDFRNAILSRVGYKRLEDDYHTDEFRMAVYMDGLEVDPVHYSEAGEFELTFNCKPQRFLTSGETATAIANNGAITNPTLFEARPLLEIAGEGDIDVSGQAITIYNSELGEIDLPRTSQTTSYSYTGSYIQNTTDTEQFEVGFLLNNDPIYATGGEYMSICSVRNNEYILSNDNVFTTTPISGTYITPSVRTFNEKGLSTTPSYQIVAKITGTMQFAYGTSQTITDTASIDVTYTTYTTGTTYTTTQSISLTATYDGNDTITLVITFSNSSQDKTFVRWDKNYHFGAFPTFKGDSSKTPGNIYIDTDIGEAYFVSNGEILNANSYVYIQNRLPILSPGSNVITYDNTITSLKITPRWWKI